MNATPAAGSADLLPGAARALWPNLTVLLVGSVLVCAGVALPLGLGGGVTPVSLVALAVTAGPLWSALIATTNEIVLGGDVGTADLLHGVRRYAGDGMRVALVPCALTALTVLSLDMFRESREVWLLGPLAVGCVASVLSVLGGVVAAPLRLEGGLRGRRLWATGLALVAARPLVPAGALALLGLGILAGTSILASLLPLLAGPLALVVSAGTWTAAGQVGLRVPLRHHSAA